MKNYIVIHGHFYQPPREDPWLGTIPNQPSAAPYHNWNKRITKECYAANSASRVLNGQGKIIDIINNYQYLSFNFGPTLFHWIKKHAPNVYHRIIEADEKSRELNNGHGNAIAQAFNHTILPLDHPQDRYTQIHWGLEDFKSHFHREAEGIWLPETAVNEEVLDILIEKGVRFIILSPWQAEAVSPAGSRSWKPLRDAPVPSEKPYRIDRAGGSIAVFFYNHILAQGISFEHYLKNAESLYNSIRSFYNKKDPSHLISIATDGEVYGHHEPFGDMCLAALTKLAAEKEELTFTNYGNYLDRFPPQDRVKLKPGEDERGSSWSCAHGVSRWYKDCGCSTGGEAGWNQQWRTPLREGLEAIREELYTRYEKNSKELSDLEPTEIRNRYIQVLNGTVERHNFAREVIRPDVLDRANSDEEVVRLYTLLESQKYAMYMFTSCGWFFNDISGIETEQNLRYAVKAVELSAAAAADNSETSGPSAVSRLLHVLKNAQSNDPRRGTGKDILESIIAEDPKDMKFIAAVFTFLINLCSELKESYGFFDLIEYNHEKKQTTDGRREYHGSVTIRNNPLTLDESFTYHLADDDETGISLRIENHEGGRDINLNRMPKQLLEDCSYHLSDTVQNRCINFGSSLYRDMKKVLRLSKESGIIPSPLIVKTAEFVITCILTDLFTNHHRDISEERIDKIEETLVFAKEMGLEYNRETVEKQIAHSVSEHLYSLQTDLDDKTVGYVYRLLKAVRNGGIEPDLSVPQNIIFSIIKEQVPSFYEELEKGDVEGLKKLKRIIKIGSILNIDVEDIKELILA
jgi:hypothetical protein